MPNIESGMALLIQIPLVGIFIWYSLSLWRLSTAAQDKFMEALDKRDKEYEKRNDKVCANLEKLALLIDRMDTKFDMRLDKVKE